MIRFVTSQVVKLDEEDKPEWRHTALGDFSVRSAYMCQVQGNVEEKWPWKLIWKLNIPQRCKMFMGLACKNGLMTNDARVQRDLTLEDECVRCRGEVENVIHVLRDCSKAQEVWLQLLPARYYSSFFGFMEVKPWMKWNLKADFKVDGYAWPSMFALIANQLWLARNKFVFDREVIDSKVVIAKVKACLSWGGDSVSRHLICDRSDKVWAAPEKGYVKLNVDGACLSHGGMAACARVLRDNRGEVRGGFLFNIGMGDSFYAETWGILMGLKWCWDYGVRHLVVESDCLELIQMIECSRDMNVADSTTLNEIVSYFKRDWELHIQWCRREVNELADRLSKHALLVGPGLVTFCQVPYEFAELARLESEIVMR